MKKFIDSLFVKFIEPLEVFEQLEERIVLDASIGAITDQNVPEASTMNVDVQATDEGETGFTYSLEIDSGSGPQSVADFNAGVGADVSFNQSTGLISWTPNNHDVGSYTFIVSSNDGGNGSAPHTDQQSFQVTVDNIAPVITSVANGTFTEDAGPQVINISADFNLGGAFSLSGAPGWLSLTTVNDGQNAILSADPGNAETGVHVFSVLADDGHGGVTSQIFTLTVNNTLDFTTADNASVVEDTQLLFDVHTDSEQSGKPVTYSLTGAPGWVSIDPSTGVISGNPDNTLVGSYNFVVNAQSAEGNQSQPFTLTVQNDAPGFLNFETTIHMTENSGNQTFDVQNEDEGISLSAVPYTIVSLDGGTVPSWLSINQSTGLITANPPLGTVGSHTLVVQFNDGNAPDGVQQQTFTLDIGNIPNEFTSSDATTWTEDVQNQSFNVQTVEEGLPGAGVTYSFDLSDPKVTGGGLIWDNWLQIDPTTGVIRPIDDLSQPDNSRVGDHHFTIVSTEYTGASPVLQDFTLTVTNTPPEIGLPNTVNVQEDSTGTTFQVQLTDPEPGAVFSLINPPTIAGVQVSIDPNTGLMTIPTGGNVDVGGIYVFNVRVDDQHGGVATQFFTINLVNKVPVFTELPSTGGSGYPELNVTEDSPFSFDLNVASPLNDEADGPTTYSLLGAPGFLSINSATGVLSGTPDNGDVGSYTFTVRLNDGKGGVTDQVMVINVANVAPSFPAIPNVTWIEDGGYQSFSGINNTDEGQGPATYSFSDAPSWLNIDTNTGYIWAVPENAQVGAYFITVTANDGHGGVVSQSFTLTVQNVAPSWDPLRDPSNGSPHYDSVIDINGSTQIIDLHTTDERSDNNNEYILDLPALPSWLSIAWDDKTGQIVVDPTGPGVKPATFDLDIPIHFFDGTVTIDQTLQLHFTDIPPIDPIQYDPGFYSPNTVTWLEDEPDQVFNVQWQNENDAGVSYQLLAGAPDWISIDPITGVISANSGSPTNDQVTYDPVSGSHTPYTFTVRVFDPSASGGYVDTVIRLYVDNVDPIWTTPPMSVVFTEDGTTHPGYSPNNTDENHGTETEYTLAAGADAVPDWLAVDRYTGEIYATRTLTNAETMGTWNIRIVFDDGHGGVIDQTLTVTLDNVLNFTTPGSAYWQEDSSTQFSFDVNTDDDPAVTYSLVAGSIPTWLQGHLTIDPSTGVLSTDAGFSADNTLPGTHTFVIHAEDGHGGGNQTFTLIVPNRDPVFTQTTFIGVDGMHEDSGTDIIDLHTDDEGQGTTYYTWSGAPQWMQLDPLTGIITADPTNRHVGTYTFTVTAHDLNGSRSFGYVDPSDPDGITGSTTETITIEVVNRDPVFSSSDNTTVQEDTALSFNVQTDDEFDDKSAPGTTYSLVGSGVPSWISINSKTGLITGNPTNAEVGDYTFLVRVDDGNGSVVDQNFTLHVTNKAVSFLNPPGTSYTFTLTEDATPVRFNLLSDDEGQHNLSAGTQVYYSLDPATTPPGVRFADDGFGFNADAYGFLCSTSGVVVVSPTNSEVVNDPNGLIVPIKVFDGNGGEDTINFVLKVQNTDPVYTTPNAVIWTEEQLTNLPFNVSTTDEPFERFFGDKIDYTLIGAPSWLQIDAKTGELSIDPLSTQNADGSPDNHLVGVYTFTIDFFDGTVHAYQPFTLTVNNSPTDITTHVSDQVITEDTLLQITNDMVHAIDEYSMYTEDYYTLEISLNNNGTWIRIDDGTYNTTNNAWNGADIIFDTKTGAISWTPNNADVPKILDAGVYHHAFRITHHDGHGSSDVDTFFITIDNVEPTLPQDPIPPLIPDWVLTEDTLYSYLQNYLQSDEEGVGVTYRLQISVKGDGSDWTDWNAFVGNKPNGTYGGAISFNTQTGEIIWTPTNADVTFDAAGNPTVPYKFRVQADDGNPTNNLSPWREFSVTVLNADTQVGRNTSFQPLQDRTVNEDSPMTLANNNVVARDEQIEAPSGSIRFSDTYFELWIDVDNTGPLAPVLYTDYNASNDALAADITFNRENGAIGWTPNDRNLALNENSHQFLFIVKHFDGRGDEAQDDFVVTVNNQPPRITNIGTWNLVEDDTAANSTYNIQSDEENLGIGVTYKLEFWDGVSWINVTSGYQPNGPTGGIINFDPVTGVVVWQTTNADVTVNSLGGQDRPAYQFRVSADDAHPATSYTNPPLTFNVNVWNTATDITDTGPQALTEDSPWTLDGASVYARDEQIGTGTYYSLQIDDGTGPVSLATWNANNGTGNDIVLNTLTGQIDWTPNNADVGNYTFTLTHNDGHQSTASDNFTVTVTNDPPTLTVPATWDVHEDTLFTLDQSLVDSSDEGIGPSQYILYIDGVLWTPGYSPNAGGGAIVFNTTTGQIDWQSTNADVTIDTGGNVFRAPYEFVITIDDGHGGVLTASPMLVTVTNEPTVVGDIPNQPILEDDHLYINTTATDEQVGLGTYYTLEVDDGSGSVDVVTYNLNAGLGDDIDFNVLTGEINWDPNNEDVGTYTFVVTHYDNHNTSSFDTFQITVNNRPPTITNPGPWTLIEDDTAANSTLDIFSDDEALSGGVTYLLEISLDNGLTWSTVTSGDRPNGPTGGEILFDENTGVIVWQTTNADVTINSLGLQDRTPYLFRISGDDNHPGVDYTNPPVQFSVNVRNDPTNITDIGPQSLTEHVPFTLDGASVNARDEQIGTGTSYSLLIDNGSGFVTLATWNANNGTGSDISLNTLTGQIDWTPNNADVGNYTFRMIHNDGHQSTAPDDFTVSVTNVPPTLDIPISWEVHEDTLFTLDQSDVDSSDEGQGPTHYTLYVDGVAWYSGFRANADGGEIIFNTLTGEIDWQSTNADVTVDSGGAPFRAPYVFTIEVDDGHGGVTSKTMDVTVTNEATVISDITNQSVTEDNHLTVSELIVTATDEQVGPGTYYTLEVDDGSGFVSLTTWNANNGVGDDISFNATNGQIDWDPNNEDVGTYTFRVTHYDNHNTSSSDTFQVSVNNRPPAITNPGPWTLIEDDTAANSTLDIYSDDEALSGGVTYLLEISLDNGLTWTTVTSGDRPNGPTGGEILFDENTGVIVWQTTNADVTINSLSGQDRIPYLFRISGDDSNPGVEYTNPPVQFSVNVLNDPTDITDVGPQSLTEDTPFTLNDSLVQARDEEVGTGTSYSLQIDNGSGFTSLAAWNASNGMGADISFNTLTGQIDWTPNNADVGNYTFRITHNDGHQSTASDDFSVSVANNDPTLDVPISWEVHEDTLFTLDQSDVNSSDEGVGPTQYTLYVDGIAWYSGFRANADGGVIVFNTATGEIDWQSTNADVTIDTGGGVFRAPYVFTIEVNDGHGGVVSKTMNVDVTNEPTIISDITNQTITEDSHLTVSDLIVTATDEQVGPGTYYTLEVDDGSGFVSLVTWNANNGTGNDILFNTISGQIDWDPNNADVGTYTFRVTHYDNHNASSSDTFQVDVANNDPTLDIPISWEVHEDTLFTLDESDVNSSDEGVGPTQYTLYVDGIAWYSGFRANADGGVIDFNTATGEIDWQSTNADVTIDTGGGVFRAPYVFTIEVNDGHGGVVSKTMNVDVTNEPTVISDITNQSVTEDSHLTVSDLIVTATDEQVGPGTYYTLEVDDGSGFVSLVTWNANNGTGNDILFNTISGQIDWDPNNADVGTYTFRVTHYDNHNASSSDTFQVDVANNDPTLDVPISWEVHEDTLFTLDESDVNSSDEGVGPTQYTLYVDGVAWYSGFRTNADGGEIVFNTATGEIDWQSTNADVTIDTGGGVFRAPYVFTIEVNDGHGGVVSKTMNVDVTNEPTIISDVPNQTVTEDTHLTVSDLVVNATDEQVGPGTYYTLEVDDGSGFVSLGTWNANNGTGNDILFNTITGQIDWYPNNADVGTYTFRVTHYDNHNASSSDTFQVDVANNDPTLDIPISWEVHEDTLFTLDQSDVNSSDEGVGPTQYTLYVDGIAWYSGFRANADGGVIDFNTATGEIDWQSTNADVTIDTGGGVFRAPYVFTIEVNDGHGGVVSKTMNVDVTNEPTIISDITNQTITEDSHLTVSDLVVNATDEQVGPGTYYTLEVDDGSGFVSLDTWNANNGTGNDILFNTTSGQIDWDPNNADVGTYTFRVTHYDNHNTSNSDTFQVDVANNDPTLDIPISWEVHEDTLFTLDESDVNSSDEGVGPTQYMLYVDGVAWYSGFRTNADGGEIVFNTATGEIDWQSTNADVTIDTGGGVFRAPYVFTIEVNDGHGGVVSKTMNVDVTNEPTIIGDVPNQTVTEDTHLTVSDLVVNATDEQVGPGTYYTLEVDDGSGFVSLGTWNANNGAGGDILFDGTSGQIDWDPNNADVGTYTFRVTHYDNHNTSSSDTFQVRVNNDPSSFTVPSQWTLHEDDGTNNPGIPSLWTLDETLVNSSDEGVGPTQYTLYIDGVLWTPGYRPNGPDGGEVVFNSLTGEIQWQTTNTDVTIDTGGDQFRAPYQFTIHLDDGHGGTADRTMDVNVTNEVTVIGAIPDQVIQEDGISLDLSDAVVHANDERVGPGTFYTLEIERDGDPGFVDVSTYNATNNQGSDIAFDATTGSMKWDTTNRDVGQYTFRVTHHDGHQSTSAEEFNVSVLNTDPVFTTPPPDGEVIRATLWFQYDPNTTDEGQHDWRGDDNVTYSLFQAPSGMTIDSHTGFVQWRTDPAFAGDVPVTILVLDGNGGSALQSFTITVDLPAGDMPYEPRNPEVFPIDKGPDEYRESLERFDIGSPDYKQLLDKIVFPEDFLRLPGGSVVGDILHPSDDSLEAVLKNLSNGNLQQPIPEYHGSVPPVTKLEGYTREVFLGKRLYFDAEEIDLWERMEDLAQPNLGAAGSTSPETPLEGYSEAVEEGKRLNFGFFPIQEAVSLKLEDLKIADILGL
ncbi:putative Ig domain-containing protein [Desulfomonile tiedjei]|uniref:Putative Ig domain-containing protein n=1 Tax=Desulfomonile tiedjei (strain ATCC 49306 / DSM 6799 / DCB-1) TaxID=706587 RepID=I4C2H9_DESTA|nr:putative Ig domain-containing protein [Desulfomonile tiedjei]AFM23770.1 putative Ig domain-containing protein [Desulfomonile tiedjei DSM 6799]